MVAIDVEYCASCRLSQEAVRTRRALADYLRGYDDFEGVSLVPSEEEVICVSVDGESVWSTDPGDRVDPMEAVAAVRSRLN